MRRLAAEFLRDPVQISVGNANQALTANRDVQQLVEVLPSPMDRDGALISHINRLPMGSKVCSSSGLLPPLPSSLASPL